MNKEIVKQSEIVSQRLQYHFAQPNGEWNLQGLPPFMKEFLNEVKTLCEMTKGVSVNATTIIPKPTWTDVLELLERHKTLRISTVDAETFKEILNASKLKYTAVEDGKDLTRFTLVEE